MGVDEIGSRIRRTTPLTIRFGAKNVHQCTEPPVPLYKSGIRGV